MSESCLPTKGYPESVESISKTSITNHSIVNEICWGSYYRDRKKCMQDQVENKQKQCSRHVEAGEPDQKITVWRPEDSVRFPSLYESKLICNSKIVNRNELSPQQHLRLLAQPKTLMLNSNLLRPVRRSPVPCTPRVIFLASPNKRKILNTWQDYHYTLPLPKIEKLLQYLNSNSTAMGLLQAQTCFKDIETKIAKLKEPKEKRSKKKQKAKRYLEEQAVDFAFILCLYLFNGKQTLLNENQRKISNMVSHKLSQFSLLRLSLSSKSIYYREQIFAIQHAGCFVFSVLSKVEAYSFVHQESLELSDTSDITDLFDSQSIEMEMTPEDETPSIFLTQQGEGEEQDDRCLTHLMKLLVILRQYYTQNTDSHEKKVFSETSLPDATLHQVMNEIEQIMNTAFLSEPLLRLQQAYELKITEWVLETSPEELNDVMREDIYFLSYELARMVLDSIIMDASNVSDLEDVPEELRVTTTPPPSEEDLQDRQQNTVEVPTFLHKKTVSFDCKTLTSKIICPPSYVRARDLNIKHPFNITPHTPGLVCCASLKVWASWVKDVAENAKMWCLWINQTIREMRRMAALVRGEVVNTETCQVSCDDWNNFVACLNHDINAWRDYNNHVQTLTEQAVEHFQAKRISCCSLCDTERLELSQVGVEHLCEQLFDAMQTTEYWRQWLQNMVNEAQSLTGLCPETETAIITEITSSTEMLAIAGVMINQQVQSVTQTEPSIYSIELVDSI